MRPTQPIVNSSIALTTGLFYRMQKPSSGPHLEFEYIGACTTGSSLTDLPNPSFAGRTQVILPISTR